MSMCTRVYSSRPRTRTSDMKKKSRRANVADQESNGRKSADMFIVDRAERAAGEGREQVGS